MPVLAHHVLEELHFTQTLVLKILGASVVFKLSMT